MTNRVKTRERSPGRVGATTPLPKYYTDLKSVSALPSWMAHSRSTSATYIDGAGKRRYAGNNLVPNGDFTGYAFHGTNAGSSSISATGIPDPYGGNQAIQLTFGGVDTEFYRTITAPIPLRKRASFWVKGTAGETIGWAIDDDGGAGNQLITLTGAWQLVHNTSKGASNSNVYTDIGTYNFGLGAPTARVIQVYLPVIAVVEDWNAAPRPEDQIFTTGTLYQAPRFGYDYRNGALVRGGLIVEAEQRTNFLLDDIGNNPAVWGSTSPNPDQDGTTIAGKLAWRQHVPVDVTAGQFTEFYTGVGSAGSGLGANPSAVSIDFKYNNHPFVFVNLEFGTTADHWATAVFNLSGTTDQSPTETFVSTDGVIVYAKAKYRGNGEWRIYFVVKLSAANASTNDVGPVFGLAAVATGNDVTTFGEVVVPTGHVIPANASGYWLDPMLEINHEKPSQEWIPYNLTRDIDVITVANPVLPLFGGPFTASFGFLISFPYTNDFADLMAWIPGPEYLEFAAARNAYGVGNDYQMIFWSNTSQYNNSAILNPPGAASNKAAFKVSGGAAAVGANGNISSVLYSGPGNDVPYRTTSRVDIGQYSDGNFDYFQGWFEYIAFWDSALSDSDLAVVSS